MCLLTLLCCQPSWTLGIQFFQNLLGQRYKSQTIFRNYKRSKRGHKRALLKNSRRGRRQIEFGSGNKESSRRGRVPESKSGTKLMQHCSFSTGRIEMSFYRSPSNSIFESILVTESWFLNSKHKFSITLNLIKNAGKYACCMSDCVIKRYIEEVINSQPEVMHLSVKLSDVFCCWYVYVSQI